jgi:16S rRNA (guanine527-N7)-methyltransferase
MLAQLASDLFGISLTAEQVEQFDVYARELAAWNAHTNLTAITEPDAVRVRHFLDSLSVTRAVNFTPGQRVIDVGTGAGLPGLALHIAYPFLRTTLLEATGKKITFLNHMITTLGLQGVDAVHARAEEGGQNPGLRAKFDVVLARAVARLPALLEYMLPFAKIGGACVAMKGATAHQETIDSALALETLGARLRETIPLRLPDVDDTHYLIVVEKITKTPSTYPRKPGVPTRKPLE